MNPIQHEHLENAIRIGNHIIYDIVKLQGTEILPAGLGVPTWTDGNNILSLELPSIPIMAAGIKVGAREFYLCYSVQHSFLFVVETEMGKREETKYRAQYGANDNYDKWSVTQRVVWIYTTDSARAKEPQVAKYLKDYLP